MWPTTTYDCVHAGAAMPIAIPHWKDGKSGVVTQGYQADWLPIR
jgi:hypothetical protein